MILKWFQCNVCKREAALFYVDCKDVWESMELPSEELESRITCFECGRYKEGKELD